MKNLFTLLHLLVITSTLGFAQENDSLPERKILKIIHFQIDSKNPGLTPAELLTPIQASLKKYFKVDSIVNLEESEVFWTSEFYLLPTDKKLSEEDLTLLKHDKTPPIVLIRLEHTASDLLGGLIKGKRHVLKLFISLYDQQGNRIFRLRKKDSCCSNVSFGSGDATIGSIDHDSFLKLYLSVVKKFSNSQ